MKTKFWIILHHSGVRLKDQPNQFLPINNYHRQKWNSKSSLGYYGGYQSIIEGLGEIKHYRKVGERGIHCNYMNDRSIGICIAGNLDVDNITKEQQDALRGLVVRLMAKYNIPLQRVVGHNHFAQRICPGKNLSKKLVDILVSGEIIQHNNPNEIALLKKTVDILQKLIVVYVKLLEMWKGREATITK